MNLATKDPDSIPIYQLQLNSQYLIPIEIINLFKSTNLYIITQNITISEKLPYNKKNIRILKKDVLSPLPLLLTFHFYHAKIDNNIKILFFIISLKNILLIIDFDQLKMTKVHEFLIQIFNDLQKAVFTPISKDDYEIFNKTFLTNTLIYSQPSEKLSFRDKIIESFEKVIKKTISIKKFQPPNIIEYYSPMNIYLITYKARLIYCIDRYYYINDQSSQKVNFSMNKEFQSTNFFRVISIDNMSYFCIDKDNFIPCCEHIFEKYDLSEEKSLRKSYYSNITNIIEFHKNFRFPSIIQYYGYIKENHSIIYKYMKNSSVKWNIDQKMFDHFTSEIVSAMIFRISISIFFLHSHDFIHRHIVSDNIYFDSYNRAYLGGFQLMINKDFENEYSKIEFSINDHRNCKENDIYNFGEFIKNFIDRSGFKDHNHELIDLSKKCMDLNFEKRINAHELFLTIVNNNFFYHGNKINELNSLITNKSSSNNDISSSINNSLKSLKISNLLTLVNLKNSSNFEFNLMDIHIFKLKNKIFQNVIVDIFLNAGKNNLWSFAVFNFMNYEDGYFNTNYFCICVEKKYFLINSYFLFSMKDFLKELSKLILIPVSIEAKLKLENIVNQYNERNQDDPLSFKYFNEKEIQEIHNSIEIIEKICKISIISRDKEFSYSNNELNRFIQPLKNYKKYFDNVDFVLPLLAYFLQRIFYESSYFEDFSFFNRFSKFGEFANLIENKFYLNDFQILRLIGSGGSARVYLAIHNITLTFVALKFYDMNNESLFLKEKLFFEKYRKQKYIVEYYGSFYDKTKRCCVLILNFKSNTCISKFFTNLHKNQNFYYKPKFMIESDLVMKIILNLLFAIHHLHTNMKCINQDLSIYNVMIDQNFDIFLSDFESLIAFDPENPDKNDFKKDIIRFCKIVYYLCKKKEIETIPSTESIEPFQVSNKSFKFLNLILKQCFDDSFVNHCSLLLLIYEIRCFGCLFPNKNTELFDQIFSNNKDLFKNIELNSNLNFKPKASIENKKMISFLSNPEYENVKFVSYLLGVCYQNGFIVQKDIQKALYYFNYDQIDSNNENLFEIISILSDKNSPIIDYNKAIKIYNLVQDMYLKDNQKKKLFAKVSFRMGLIFMKGIGIEKNYSKAKEFFSNSINLTKPNENYLFLISSYQINKILEKENQIELAFKLNLDLVEKKQKNESIKFNGLISKIYYHIALYLYKKKENVSSYLLKSISFDYDNYKAIKFFGFCYFHQTKSILPESCSFFDGKKVLSKRTYEALGDIYYLNNDIDNSIRYYSYTSKLGECKASFKLGIIYSIKKDIRKSIYYFTKVINYKNELDEYELKELDEYELKELDEYELKELDEYELNELNNLKPFEEESNIEKLNKEEESNNEQSTEEESNNNDKEDELIDFKLVSNIFILKFKIKYGCIELHQLERYKYFTIDFDKKKVKDTNDQYYMQLFKKYFLKDFIISLFCLMISSDLHNSNAQYELGSFYYEGRYIQQNISRAIEYFTFASQHNHQKAQFNLGVIYYEGEGIPQDIHKAIHYFTLAANQNNVESQFNLGLIFSEGEFIQQDIQKAIDYFILAADQNNTEAQFNLGLIFSEGEFIDIQKAIHYFELASKNNLSTAHFNLGLIYYEGKYVKRDVLKAIHYFNLASSLNYSKAHYNLGLIYYEGKYVNRDINKAIEFFQLASNQNFSEAQFNLGYIFNLEKDIQKAVSFYEKASKLNNSFAKNNLAVAYIHNNNVGSAKLLLRELVYVNDLVALYNLATVYFNENNLDVSISFLIKAANLGFSRAENLLSIVVTNKYHTVNLEIIKNEFSNFGITNFNLESSVFNLIKNCNLENVVVLNNCTQKYRKIYYIYDIYHKYHDFADITKMI